MNRLSQHLYEMSAPSYSPAPPRGTLGAAAVNPVFQDVSGNIITSIPCGGTYTFTVPGYEGKNVWLTMWHDGVKGFDGLFPIPMYPYTSNCVSEPGAYQAVVYDPDTDIVIGQTTFSVVPSSGVPPVIPAPPNVTSGGPSFLSSLTTTQKALLAAAAALLFLKKKGRKK